MASKLSQIFGFRKTTFNAPSPDPNGSYEQDTLFIQVDEAMSNTGNGRATSKVTGQMVVYVQMNKMPFGYFNKRIQQADHSLTKDFFFFDIDLNPVSSPARLQNITERRVKFVYLYSAQYDPDHGEMTSLEI